ncbi:MAG: MMPL family transporter [Spirochaetales bacterium]|nr:MMPL family transporter [Spirochaetales bacterium]
MKIEELIMQALARFVTRYCKIIPFVGAILIILSFIAASNIEMKTEMDDMLPENNPKIEMYKELDDLFSGGSMVMITVEGEDKERMIECAEAFASEVKANKTVMDNTRAINLKVDREYIKKWGLLLQEADDLEKTGKFFKKVNLLPFITAINDSFEETYTGDEAEEEINTRKQENEAVGMLNQMESFFIQLKDYLEEPGKTEDAMKNQGKMLAETFLYGDEYGFNYDNTMLLFTISPDFNIIEIEKINEMMTEIKAILKKVQKNFPDLKVGYTGDVATQGDEQDAMSFDMSVPSLVALALILLLFIFSFKQIRAVVFVIIALICGVIFSFGFLGITLGEVNMLTSMMAVLLIGLGVDYGIQVIVNFNTYREEGYTPEDAIKNTYIKSGLGITMAAVTTAIGFFVLSATGSKAFVQFGIVMGIGIVMCLIAMMFILPSLLLLFGKKKDFASTRLPKINFNFLSSLGKITYKYRWVTLIAGLIITAGLLYSAFFLNKYEYDIMKLEPQQMPSIVQYDKVMEKFDINPYASMYIAESIEEARELTEKLEKQKLVAQVSSISQLIPDKDEIPERIDIIRELHNIDKRYTTFFYSESELEEFIAQVDRLEDNIIEIGQLSVAGLGEDNKIVRRRNEMIREIFGAEVGRPGKEVFQKLIALIKSDPPLYAERLSLLDLAFAPEMDRIIDSMTDIKDSVTQDDILADLPESYRKNYFDKSGTKNLIMIYPRQDIFADLANTERFNSNLEKVSQKITGTPQILVEWLKEFNEATPKAALFIFLSVFVFLLLTFRSLKYTLFATVPLVVGMIWMLGAYPLFGLKMNMVNVIIIPLVIGMGIDFGIHIAHRYKTEGDIETTYRYTGKGVFLSALTTMIGFGSLSLVGSFPSIASLGSILFFGITACLLTTLIILPALLSFIKKKERKVPADKK